MKTLIDGYFFPLNKVPRILESIQDDTPSFNGFLQTMSCVTQKRVSRSIKSFFQVFQMLS